MSLTRELVIALVESAKAAGREPNLSGYDLSGLNLGGEGVVWQDVVFGRHHGPRPANLNGTSFRDSTLEHCFFAHADLTDADFRNCTINRCDFRYAHFHRTTFEEAEFYLCDLYRAIFFEGTVMRESVFRLVSLAGSLEGATGLRWTTFAGKDPPALVPEDEDEYRAFLEWTKKERGLKYSTEDALKDRLTVAAGGYRNISALMASRGQFDDASKAYVHARRLERKSAAASWSFKGNGFASFFSWLWTNWGFKGKGFRPFFTWLGLLLADGLCGFGTKLGIIIPWVIAVALLPGIAYFCFGGVSNAHGIVDDLVFSLLQMTGTTPTGVASSNHVVELIGVGQWFAGVALLGLFGFVLGNKLRSS